MNRTPSLRGTLWLWIACLAVLANALAPSVSHALSYSRGVPASWEICRADGVRVTVTSLLGADPAPEKKTAAAMGEDCAYCATHAGSFGLPPSTISGLSLPSARQLHPFLFYRAPQPLAVWSAAQPRGPPALT